jgi:hypothetical protein
VLGIETPCIIAVIGVQAGGGAPEFGTISFHFVGTDNDKIKKNKKSLEKSQNLTKS